MKELEKIQKLIKEYKIDYDENLISIVQLNIC